MKLQCWLLVVLGQIIVSGFLEIVEAVCYRSYSYYCEVPQQWESPQQYWSCSWFWRKRCKSHVTNFKVLSTCHARCPSYYGWSNWETWSSWSSCSFSSVRPYRYRYRYKTCGVSTRSCCYCGKQNRRIRQRNRQRCARSCSLKAGEITSKIAIGDVYPKGDCIAAQRCDVINGTVTLEPVPATKSCASTEKCTPNIKGVYQCTKKPVNGYWTWGQWGSWSDCSKSCRTGTEKRIRLNICTPPRYGGKPCQTAPRTHTFHRDCNSHIPCPEEKGDSSLTTSSSNEDVTFPSEKEPIEHSMKDFSSTEQQEEVSTVKPTQSTMDMFSTEHIANSYKSDIETSPTTEAKTLWQSKDSSSLINNSSSSTGTAYNFTTSCVLPSSLQNGSWDDVNRLYRLRFGKSHLSGYAINAQGDNLDNYSCISSTGNTFVFKSDQSYSDEGNQRWLYLCMKLKMLSDNLFYYYLLSDIDYSVSPSTRLFTPAYDNNPDDKSPTCEFCQFSVPPSDSEYQLLRKTGTNEELTTSAKLCLPCEAVCADSPSNATITLLVVETSTYEMENVKGEETTMITVNPENNHYTTQSYDLSQKFESTGEQQSIQSKTLEAYAATDDKENAMTTEERDSTSNTSTTLSPVETSTYEMENVNGEETTMITSNPENKHYTTQSYVLSQKIKSTAEQQSIQLTTPESYTSPGDKDNTMTTEGRVPDSKGFACKSSWEWRYYSDPDNCAGFIWCFLGIPVRNLCTEGTIWSQQSLACERGTC